VTTAREALLKVEAHERECAIRYENIEKRLDEGSAKFRRLEYIMWGLYGLTAASLGIDKLI
jgi:hypothetical protein|tara:strand:- start:2157 stop:2339 length:183 start_codon:yes stop_codon:yes gene_type:complete